MHRDLCDLGPLIFQIIFLPRLVACDVITHQEKQESEGKFM